MNNEEQKKENWKIQSWEEFRKALASMNSRNKLYKEIKAELKKRKNWRNSPRGSSKS